jgi:hypothetical protein
VSRVTYARDEAAASAQIRMATRRFRFVVAQAAPSVASVAPTIREKLQQSLDYWV